MSSEEHYEQIIKGLQVQLQAKRQLLKSRDIEVTLLNERVKELEAGLAQAEAYADKLAEGLPCLPKDVEVLQEANTRFAAENKRLKDKLGLAKATLKDYERNAKGTPDMLATSTLNTIGRNEE